MNKIKLAFIAIAILAAVGGAFATRPCVTCYNNHQYIPNGAGGWQDVGLWGEDFDCTFRTGGICTYYQPDPVNQPTYYAPCHIDGAYYSLQD